MWRLAVAIGCLAACPLVARAAGGPGSAQALSVNGPSANAKIDADADRDWFSFQARRYAGYVITVTTAGVWDCVFELRTPDGAVALSETATVWGGSAEIGWTNNTVNGRFYLRVGGFGEFTTGAYSVAVSGGSFADANVNGLPDAWELLQFGNLTNTAAGDNDADGLDNGAEYASGTDATNGASRLSVGDVRLDAGGAEVGWPAVPYGLYRVLVATNLAGHPEWRVVATNMNTEAASAMSYADSGVTNDALRFFRVEFVY